MKFRTTLDTTANQLKVMLSLDMDTDNTRVFRVNIDKKYEMFIKDITDSADVDDAIIMAKAKPVKEAIALFNDEMRMERIEQLSKMKYQDAMKDFLRTQFVSGLAFGKVENVWGFHATEEIAVDFYDVLSVLNKPAIPGIMDAACIYMDNLAKFEFKDDGAHIAATPISAGYVALRARMKWDIPADGMSKNVLARQLNELAHMVFAGAEPKMINPDVTYITKGIILAKDESDKAGSYQLRDEKTMLKYLFRAVYTRTNGLAYGFQNDTRADKNPMSVAHNKAMAEAPAKTEKKTKATETKVSTGEKKVSKKIGETAAK